MVQALSFTYDPIGNITHVQDDADIANVIHEVNAGEIAAGKIAQTKASNAEVKAYAWLRVSNTSLPPNTPPPASVAEVLALGGTLNIAAIPSGHTSWSSSE